MKLSELSELAHNVFDLYKERALKLKQIKSEARYITTVVYVNGIFDRIIYDKKSKRFMVELCIGVGKGICLDLMDDGAFFEKVEYKKVLIHRSLKTICKE